MGFLYTVHYLRYMSLQTAKIEVTPFLPMKGIYYIGQYGTSGYACAARGYLYHYFQLGIPITWDPLKFDDSELDDIDPCNLVVKTFIGKKINYDMVIMHSTPDLWPVFWKSKKDVLLNKIVIGYCTWETDIVPAEWVGHINNCVHELWVPSTYNRDNFKKSGVTIPIRIVPHIFLPTHLPERNRINLYDPNRYTFYTIGEWHSRKNISDVVISFCKAFNSSDSVRLVIKTHYKTNDMISEKYCMDKINDILDIYPNHAPVICLLKNLSEHQIKALHSVGDCYVSLTRSEGFGLPIFDAFNYGKKIICTGYSGQVDFLGKDHPGLVRYELGKVFGMRRYAGFDDTNDKQQWAYPDVEHAAELMRKII